LRLYDLLGFVFMPEHVHVVVLPCPGIRISRILVAMKVPVAKRAVLWIRVNAPDSLRCMEDRQPNGRCSYRFWQRGGGYDRNLRTAADVREKIRYIHANPIRRGLVTAADDWHWSSYRAWQTGEDVPIPIDREVLTR
jgi:putative transposase